MPIGWKFTETSRATGLMLPIASRGIEEEFAASERRLKIEQQHQEAVLETNQITVQNLIKEINVLKKRNYLLLDEIKGCDSGNKVSKTVSSETFMAEVASCHPGKNEAGRGESQEQAQRGR